MLRKIHIWGATAALFSLLAASDLHAAYSVTREWSTYAGGEWANDSVKAAAIDSNGRVYFGGYLGNGELCNDDGVEPTSPPYYEGGKDGFVAQANSSGVLQWYVVIGDTDNDEVRGIAEYGQSVYAAAVMERTAYLDDGTDAHLYALSKSDGSLTWSSPFIVGAAGATNGFNAVAIDAAGNIYAAGYTSIAQIDPTPAVPGYTIGSRFYGHSLKGGLDACVVKVSPAGELVWAHYLGGARNDSALTCTVGANGYLYVGGETYSTGWVSHASGVLPTATQKAGFVVKLSTDGEHLWSTYLSGSNNDAVNALAYESVSGKLFAAGTTHSSDFMNAHPRKNSPAGSSDGFVCRITDNGSSPSVDWSRFYGSAQAETLTALRVLDDSELVLGGTTPNGAWLTDPDNPHGGGDDAYIAVLHAETGDTLWSSYTGGSSADRLHALTARNGIFYAGGVTRSESWVSGGFHTTWNKDNLWGNADEFGFLVKYQSGGYTPDLPEITAQPQPVSVEEQRDAHFSIAATGTEPLFYQWRVNGDPVAGATGSSFTLKSVQLAQSGDLISCLVSNAAGSVVSGDALLTVTAIPSGFITVAITPAGAVDAGAAWSIDAGTTWLASGATVNVVTGGYPIVYRDNLFGWAAPATPNSTTVLNGVTNTLQALYTQVFYTHYRQISGTNVTVVVDPPAGAEQIFVIETLPVGLTPYDYAPFQWVSSSRQLRYITHDTVPLQLSYAVTGPEGTYSVSGTVNFGSGGVTTVGDTQIVIGGAAPPVPPPDIIAFAPGAVPGSYLLTFLSVHGQSYLVETNAAPAAAGWALQGQVSGEADQTTTAVPAPAPALFYRVRTPGP